MSFLRLYCGLHGLYFIPYVIHSLEYKIMHLVSFQQIFFRMTAGEDVNKREVLLGNYCFEIFYLLKF